MSAPANSAPALAAPPSWQAAFLAMLPSIEDNLSYAFRRLNPDAREEAIQEGVANCLVQYERLTRQNRAAVACVSSLSWYAIRQVKAGRQVGGKLNVRDPLSRYAQQRKGIRVERVDRFCPAAQEWIQAALEDRRSASIPEVVALRLDVTAWLRGFARRTRRIARDLAMGFSTREAAQRHQLSPARISQLRRELYESWRRFHGADSAAEPVA